MRATPSWNVATKWMSSSAHAWYVAQSARGLKSVRNLRPLGTRYLPFGWKIIFFCELLQQTRSDWVAAFSWIANCNLALEFLVAYILVLDHIHISVASCCNTWSQNLNPSSQFSTVFFYIFFCLDCWQYWIYFPIRSSNVSNNGLCFFILDTCLNPSLYYCLCTRKHEVKLILWKFHVVTEPHCVTLLAGFPCLVDIHW